MNYDDEGLAMTEKHVFFFKSKCPFSNFYMPCSFTYAAFDEYHRFFSSEQAFMWHKAMQFGDKCTAQSILHNGNKSPKYCKEQGRIVKNYDDSIWSELRFDVFFKINLEKFSQDSELKRYILDSRFDGKTFVEASPYDSIWGICMKIDDCGIDDESNWKGQNLLGKVITKVRNTLLDAKQQKA